MLNVSKTFVVAAVVAWWCLLVGVSAFLDDLINNPNLTAKETLEKFIEADRRFAMLVMRTGTVYDLLVDSPECQQPYQVFYSGTSCYLTERLIKFDGQTLETLELPPGNDHAHCLEAIVRVFNVVESVGVTFMCRFAHISMMLLAKPLYRTREIFTWLMTGVLSAIKSKFHEHGIPITPAAYLIEIYEQYNRVENPPPEYKDNVGQIFAEYALRYGHLSEFTKLSNYPSVDFKTDIAVLERLLEENVAEATFYFDQTQGGSSNGAALAELAAYAGGVY